MIYTQVRDKRFTKKIPNNSQIGKEAPLMEKVLFAEVNQKLIGGGFKTNLNKIINNNIDKDYEITNRNISDFSQSFFYSMKGRKKWKRIRN